MKKLQSLLSPGFERIGELHTIPQDDIGHPRHTEFRHENMFYNIVVVGLGGTGGYVVRDLSRFLYSIVKREDDFNYRLCLVDGDTVEEKNLLRQNFLPRDLGKNKAVAMAERHSRAFCLDIEAFAQRIDKTGDLSSVLSVKNRDVLNSKRIVNIIVGCVDNNKARRIISSYLTSGVAIYNQNYFWIDSGNERKGGQVICGGKYQSNQYTYSLPTVTDLYPEILDPEQDSQSQVSCAERLMQDEQNIFVNIDAATHVLNFIRKIVLAEEFQIHGVEFNIDGKVASRHLAQAA